MSNDLVKHFDFGSVDNGRVVVEGIKVHEAVDVEGVKGTDEDLELRF